MSHHDASEIILTDMKFVKLSSAKPVRFGGVYGVGKRRESLMWFPDISLFSN